MASIKDIKEKTSLEKIEEIKAYIKSKNYRYCMTTTEYESGGKIISIVIGKYELFNNTCIIKCEEAAAVIYYNELFKSTKDKITVSFGDKIKYDLDALGLENLYKVLDHKHFIEGAKQDIERIIKGANCNESM